jgi:hypothetical protein
MEAHKLLGIFWVAEQLLASQEGLVCLEVVEELLKPQFSPTTFRVVKSR